MPYINKKTVKSRQPKPKREKDGVRRRIYDSGRWRQLRLVKLQSDPLCEECAAAGRTRLATQVHHERSFTEAVDMAAARALAFDYGNLRSLCDECHGRIHAKSLNNPGQGE